MKPPRARAENLACVLQTIFDFPDVVIVIERAIADAVQEAVDAIEEETVSMLRQQQRRYLPTEGAYHALECVARDHVPAIARAIRAGGAK